MLLNALVCTQYLPSCINFDFSFNIINIIRVLIKLISNPNPKISKQALVCFKEYLTLFTDDFTDFKKYLLVGLKETLTEDIRKKYMSTKSPFSRPVLDLIEHEQDTGNPLLQASNVNELKFNGEESRQLKSGKSRTLSNFTSQKMTTECEIPEKFSEIPNLKSVDQKRSIILSLVDSLKSISSFSTNIPNNLFTILTHELDESNILLYSVIIELLDLLLRKSSIKLNLTSAQARVLVSSILTKYTVKTYINEMILSILDSIVAKKYMKEDAFLKNIFNEIASASNKNSRRGVVDWLCKNSLFLIANNCFDDFVRLLKTKPTFKADLEIYSKSFGGLAAHNGEEVLVYCYSKLTTQFSKDTNSKNSTYHREVLAELGTSIQEFRTR